MGVGLFSRCQHPNNNAGQDLADSQLGQCSYQNSVDSGFPIEEGYNPTVLNNCTVDDELLGTGFDLTQNDIFCPLSAAQSRRVGGGTGWLNMSGNVTPGEVITLRFAIWDTSDQYMDSTVLLDNFEWSAQAAEPGVTPG